MTAAVDWDSFGTRNASTVLALRACARALLNTEVAANAPLMSAGLDSIAAVEFTNAVSDEVGMSLAATVLFDHPTLDSIASYLAAEVKLGRTQNQRVGSINA